MLVGEFLEAYSMPSHAPETGDAIYDHSRELAHEIGKAMILSLQGERIETSFSYGIDQEVKDLHAKFADKLKQIGGEDMEALNVFMRESNHFYFNSQMASMESQMHALFDPNLGFKSCNIQADINLSFFGSSMYDHQRKQAKNDPSYFSSKNNLNRSFIDGVLNEVDTSIVLLNMARSVKKKEGRELIIVPAPPQIEWYKATDEYDYKNHHADILVIERAPEEKLKICGVQVKSMVRDEVKDHYDPDRIVMVCGKADLGNYSSQVVDPIRMERRNTNWAGQVSIESLASHVKGQQVANLIKIANRKRVLNMLSQHSLNRGKSRVNISAICDKIWPRIVNVLDEQPA